MNFAIFLIGCLSTFKAGPVVVGGFLSPSDLACVMAIGLLFLHQMTFVTRNRALAYARIPRSFLVASLALTVCAGGHALASGLSGANFTYFVTLCLVLLCAYSVLHLCSFCTTTEQFDVTVYIYFVGVVFGLTSPFVLNKIGAGFASDIYFWPGGRYKGFMLHQNQIGILSTFCFSFFLFRHSNFATKITALVACCVPLLLCTSKFNFAFCFLLTMFYIMYTYIPLPKVFRIAGVGAICIVAFMFMDDLVALGIHVLSQVNPEGADRLAEFASAPEDSEATSSRIYVWEQAWKVGTQNLPFGIGPSAAPPYLMYLSHAHNALLNYYLIYGLLGVAFVLVIIFSLFFSIARSSENNLAKSTALAASCGLASSNISDSFSNSTALPILIGVALMAVAFRRNRVQRAKQPVQTVRRRVSRFGLAAVNR